MLNLSTEGDDKVKEDAADDFAKDILIPPIAWQTFLRGNDFSNPAVIQFADLMQLEPGIVVGRL